MSKYFFFGAVLLIFQLSAAMLYAATEVDVYSDREIVTLNANQAELNQAYQQAFQRVLIRVSGRADIVEDPAVLEEISNSSRYISASRFESSDEFFINVLGESVPTKAMVMTFDQSAVDSFLVQNRLPVWGTNRPEVMVWLADRMEGTDHILSDSESTELAVSLQSAAAGRGLPLILPIMDLEDTLAINFSDVYGLFSSDIETASERYSPEAILAGRIQRRSAEQYEADWMLLFKGERLRLPSVLGTLDDALSSGVDLAAERLSDQYALILDPLLIGSLSLRVENVQSLQQFSALENYLKSINLITQVTLYRYRDDEVVFNLEISGDRFQLSDLLALDTRLTPLAEETLEQQLDNELSFVWSVGQAINTN